jgi:predicted dithiol-disulfide oxidoreductase (DUF899 family)
MSAHGEAEERLHECAKDNRAAPLPRLLLTARLSRLCRYVSHLEDDVMAESAVPHPKIVSHDEWACARLDHLAHEKALTKELDRLRAERRRLPMEKIGKSYTFEGPKGKVSLLGLFEGRRQLIVYHFMFDPKWEKGCVGCTGYIDALGDLSMLHARNTTFVAVSRAPLTKLEEYKMRRHWDVPWFSSFDNDFNYDFHVTLDESVTPIQYNYRSAADWDARNGRHPQGEEHGLSVFFRLGDEVFHTYSAYARGTESLTDAYSLLDTTPYGRQEDFEESPSGWPQSSTY